MERVKGIEPSYQAWEARVLPLNYTRNAALLVLGKKEHCKPRTDLNHSNQAVPKGKIRVSRLISLVSGYRAVIPEPHFQGFSGA
jgi:hypothetical protein